MPKTNYRLTSPFRKRGGPKSYVRGQGRSALSGRVPVLVEFYLPPPADSSPWLALRTLPASEILTPTAATSDWDNGGTERESSGVLIQLAMDSFPIQPGLVYWFLLFLHNQDRLFRGAMQRTMSGRKVDSRRRGPEGSFWEVCPGRSRRFLWSDGQYRGRLRFRDSYRQTPCWSGDREQDHAFRRGNRRPLPMAKSKRKRYTSSVGNSAVQEVVAAVLFYGTNEGCVITNSSFTPSARSLAQETISA